MKSRAVKSSPTKSSPSKSIPPKSSGFKLRTLATTAAIAALALTTAACGGGNSGASGSSGSSGGSGGGGGSITYWASNQGTSLDNDKQVLTPELEKLPEQTGIKVNLEVIGWNDLQTRIQTAVTSGQAPDVLNIGNTWAASLQATGAFLPFDDAPSRRSAARTSSSRPPWTPAARPARTRPPSRSTAWPTACTTTRPCSPQPA